MVAGKGVGLATTRNLLPAGEDACQQFAHSLQSCGLRQGIFKFRFDVVTIVLLKSFGCAHCGSAGPLAMVTQTTADGNTVVLDFATRRNLLTKRVNSLTSQGQTRSEVGSKHPAWWWWWQSGLHLRGTHTAASAVVVVVV
jgi:hypothetical protein